MKTITLKTPVPIDGPVRSPSEGPIAVTDEMAARLHAAGVLDGDPEDIADEDGGDADHEDDGLDAEKVADLKQLAEKEGVDLGDATLKADIIAAIRAHRAPQE